MDQSKQDLILEPEKSIKNFFHFDNLWINFKKSRGAKPKASDLSNSLSVFDISIFSLVSNTT
jgi:hypothetical protein